MLSPPRPRKPKPCPALYVRRSCGPANQVLLLGLLCPLAGRDRPEPPRYVHSINNSRRSSSRISQTAFLPHSRQTVSPAGFQGPPSPCHRPCEQCPAFLAFARPFAIPVNRAVCRSASFIGKAPRHRLPSPRRTSQARSQAPSRRP